MISPLLKKVVMGFGSGKLPIYEVGATIDIALDSCMVSLKKVEANQASICSASGVTMIFPFLVSDVNRSGFLRILSCPITEDTSGFLTFSQHFSDF